MLKLSLIGVGLVVLLMAMTGVASAEAVVHSLSFPTDDSTFDCGDVVVNVTVDGYNVTVELVEPFDYHTGDTKLTALAMNTSVAFTKANITAINGYVLGDLTDGHVVSFGSLGDFNTQFGFDPSDKVTGPVTITFDSPVVLVGNSPQGFSLAVHVQGLDSGRSIKIADGVCGEPVTPIPEFPTVALPIAAVIGLAFLLQRRRD
ncbi:PEF-CTERM sorting domain-containing protein [Methanococcoides sp. NM1]|uniref:PEF-CTERM sorting domain-containing protein n=1 Tax=Methanococcoides sp. NM1 TaxID=1201013 RepID=UPI001082BA7C|nr:PEF-CTERM sorting domain-containing protein [Methanococcoides sp. NM1]